METGGLFLMRNAGQDWVRIIPGTADMFTEQECGQYSL